MLKKPFWIGSQFAASLLAFFFLLISLPTSSEELAQKQKTEYYVFEDSSQILSLNQVKALKSEQRFLPVSANRISADSSDSVLWLNFSIPKAENLSAKRYLVIGPGYLDEVILYRDASPETGEEPWLISGDSVPFSDKPVNHPLHVFPLVAEASEYYVRSTSEGILRLNWLIQSQDEFTASNLLNSSWYAILLGVLASMILYNLCLYISIRDTAYLFYVLYHFSAALLIYSLSGYAGQLLWPGFANSTNSVVPIALTIMNISGPLFVYNFLELPRYLPEKAKQFRPILILVCLLALPGLALPYSLGSSVIYTCSLIVIVMIGYWVIIAWRAKVAASKFLVINFFCIVLPGALGSFGFEFGWLPDRFVFSHMLELATAAETLLLSLFLASRIKLLETEKNIAQEKNLQLQSSFSQKMVAKLEEDRSHIARELHDSIGQTLSLVHINLRSQSDESETSLSPMMDQQQTLTLLKQTISEVRLLSHRLHPSQLGRLGLISALDSLVKQCRIEGTPLFKVDISIQEEAIPESKKIHLYRIVQEAVNNILTHAQASLCRISLHKENNLILMSIQDNGRGFSKTLKENTGLGMTSMQDRANIIDASLNIESTPGEGTLVTVSFNAA